LGGDRSRWQFRNRITAGENYMAQFDVGDQVRLKSGGPVMTVRHVQKPLAFRDSYDEDADDSKVTYGCQWFAGAKLNDGVFPEGSIETADGEAKEPPKRK
jgi:uncharacterized protein YodC (DUF2158 family)